MNHNGLPTWLLVAASVAMVPLLVWFQRGGPIHADAFSFLLDHHGWSWSSMTAPHNGQFMPLTWFVFQMYDILGERGAELLMSLLSVMAQLALAWGIYTWARPRVDDWIALFGALLILTLGSGHEVLTWSFNFGWMIAMAAGTWALVLNDRGPDSTRNRVMVALLLGLSICGNNLGLVFCVAIAVQAFYRERRAIALTSVVVPVALFALWYLAYGLGTESEMNPRLWPYLTVRVVEAGFNAFIFDMIGWGAPIAVLVLVVAAMRLWRLDEIRWRLASALAIPVVFTALIVVSRTASDPAISRYKYTFAAFVVLALAEVLRGVSLRRVPQLVLTGAVVMFLVIGNVAWMSTGAATWRNGADASEEYLTALRLAGREVACSTQLDPADPVLAPVHNCRVYDEVVVRDGFGMSDTELQSRDAAVRGRVDALIGEMKKQVKDLPPQ